MLTTAELKAEPNKTFRLKRPSGLGDSVQVVSWVSARLWTRKRCLPAQALRSTWRSIAACSCLIDAHGDGHLQVWLNAGTLDNRLFWGGWHATPTSTTTVHNFCGTILQAHMQPMV